MNWNARRAVMPGVRQCAIESYRVDAPGPGEVVVRTEWSLVSSGTELAVYTGIHQGLKDPDAHWPSFPFRPGYSAAGRVLAVGAGVTGLAEGDAIAWPGNHASHARFDPRRKTWRRLPEGLDPRAAAFLYLMRFPFAAVAQTRDWAGRPLAVQGLGLIGQLALRLYVQLGAWPVVGLDLIARRREAALRGGAAAVLDPSSGDAAEGLRAVLGGRLAAVCVDATGAAEAVAPAAALVERGGQVIVLGSPRGTAREVDMYGMIHARSITLSGAHGSLLGEGHAPHLAAWTEARALGLSAHLLASGRLKVLDLVTHEVPPEALASTYEGLLEHKDAYLVALVRWDESGNAAG